VHSLSDFRLTSWHVRILTFLQVYVVTGGVISFIGWAANRPRLTDWVNNGISIQPNATVAVIAAGAALILLSYGFRPAAAVLGALVAIIGGSALFQILTGLNLGIDTLFMFGRTFGQVGTLAPGRMGPPGAASWTLIGTALILAALPRYNRGRILVPVLAVITTSVSGLSLIGYLYGASPLYTVPTLTIIALQTATFILAVSIALIMNVDEYPPMRLFAENSPAGVFARRVTPALIGIPVLLGFIRLAGERAGLYDASFGSALRTVSEIAVFLVLLWRTGSAISRQAEQRMQANEALQATQRRLVNELTDTKLLQQISSELIGEKDVDAFYGRILDAAMGIMRSDFASMQMFEPDRGHGELRLLAHRGFSWKAAKLWEWVRSDSASACGVAFGTKARVLVSDVYNCDFLEGTEDQEMFRQMGIRAVQTTPLLSRGGMLVGMISTHWRTTHLPSERDFRLLDILARQAADLIERKRAEMAREQALERERVARAEAERAARLKDDFLATVSHELRTPLTAILGWSHFLKKDVDDREKARAAAAVIERNGRVQAQLITDLLDMSRIMSGKMRLDVQRVELPLIIDLAIESIMPAANAKGLQIHRKIDPSAEPINGDPGRIQQIVWNLLSNAVKFTPRDGSIDVVLARVNTHVEIRISDTGEGIAADFLPYIFDRFRQADSSKTRPHGGLGIGLALVKQLVELHGGRVHATSGGKGQGATFAVELPVSISGEVREYSPANPTTELDQVNAGATLLGRIKVLVVDDEPDTVALVRRLLEENEAIVTTAASAEEALNILQSQTFDVIVSDIGMPMQDGYAFIAEARRRGIQTPALALTAFARPEDRAQSLSNGYQEHLSKPVQMGELLATVAVLAQKGVSLIQDDYRVHVRRTPGG